MNLINKTSSRKVHNNRANIDPQWHCYRKNAGMGQEFSDGGNTITVAKFQKIKVWRIEECCTEALSNYEGAYLDQSKKLITVKCRHIRKQKAISEFCLAEALGGGPATFAALFIVQTLCIIKCWRYIQILLLLELDWRQV